MRLMRARCASSSSSTRPLPEASVDLFSKAPVAPPKPLSVSQLNQEARLMLERGFARVSVVGEVSGHKIVQGHHYFSLKDARSQLNAVLFAREAKGLTVKLADGMQVVATGRLTIYSQYGRYQIVLDKIALEGAGALAAAFEELKVRLLAEGLFDKARKRALPKLPRRVAVVTSPTGAVIRDIVQVATRRYPRANLLLVPTKVQGADAAPSIVRALRRVAEAAPRLGLDLVIVARGGGSLEDLWCFNEEVVARAIAASPIPVVSAVGHETDFTIADFVADVRAPTPSAAAELVFPVYQELLASLRDRRERCRRAMSRMLDTKRLRLRAARGELADARALVREQVQRLSHLGDRREQALRRTLMKRRLGLQDYERRLAALHPRTHLATVRARLREAERRMVLILRQRLARTRERLLGGEARLAALSPLGVLERGYAIVLGPDGHAVRAAREVRPGDAVQVRLHEGGIGAEVTQILPGPGPFASDD
jgi:exodeoxyribonuclease VII large subunit